MSNAGVALRCPSCGAPIDRPEAQVCAFCGSTLSRGPNKLDAPRPYSGGASVGRAAFLWLAFTVLAIGISAALRARHSPPAATANRAAAPVALAPDLPPPPSISDFLTTVPRESGRPDVLVDLNVEGNPLALFDGRTRALRWRAGGFGVLRTRDVIVDAKRAYVADQSRVSAIRLADGQLLWQASLVSEINSGPVCGDGCFAVVKDQILALQRDGSLQAFDAATGQQLWNLRIPGIPDRFSIIGSALAVNRAVGRGGIDRVVDILDGKSGQVQRTLQPSCIDKVFHRTQRPDIRMKELFSADGKKAYFFFGDFSKCAQAVSVTTGEKLWNSYAPGFDSSSHVVLGQRRIVFEIGRGTVLSVETATGKVTKVVDDPETRSTPMYVVDDELILRSTPSWSSDRVSFVAVDGATGARLWQFPVSVKGGVSFGIAGESVGRATVWTRPTSDGFVVVQVLPTEQLSVDVLNLKTGVGTGRKILAAGAMPSVVMRDDLMWVGDSSRLAGFALPGATLKYQLP